MLGQIITNIKVVGLLATIRRQYSLGNLAAASAATSRIFMLYRRLAPSPETPLFANLLFANLAERQGHLKVAQQACEISMAQIGDESYPDNTTYNQDDMMYMRYIVKWILTRTSDSVDSDAWNIARSISGSFDMINISNVKPMLLEFFPITKMEGESFDEYFFNSTAQT